MGMAKREEEEGRGRLQGGKEEAQLGTSRGGSGAQIFPRCGPRYKGHHRPAAARSTTIDVLEPGAQSPAPAVMLLPGLLLLLWLPAILARHSPSLQVGAHSHPHSPGTLRCYSAEELPLGHAPPHLLARAAKWEQALPVALVSSLEAVGRRRRRAGAPAGTQCPVLQLGEVLEADVHQRSISPWRYRVDTDESRYPQKLAFAECLCRGCISTKTGRETAALNSVPLVQSLLVLRRRPCSQDATGAPMPGAFTFHAEFIRVPVGCTCVLPRSAR